MTCQSFSSLSLDPPMVMFAPARTSTTWPRIRAAGAFCVNIVADGQHGISDAMSRRGRTSSRASRGPRRPAARPARTGRPRGSTATWPRSTTAATIVVGAVRALASAPGLQPLLYHRGRYALVGDGP